MSWRHVASDPTTSARRGMRRLLSADRGSGAPSAGRTPNFDAEFGATHAVPNNFWLKFGARPGRGLIGLLGLGILGLIALVAGPLPGAKALSDDRNYEKVSPVDKNGTDAGPFPDHITPRIFPTPAAPDGDAFVYGAISSLGDGSDSGQTLQSWAISKRGASGWSTRSINPGPISPTPLTAGFRFHTFTDDLSAALIDCIDNGTIFGPVGCEEPPLLTDDAVAGNNNFYRADFTGPANTYELIQTMPASACCNPWGGEGSSDLTHAAFERFDQDDMVHEGFIDGNGDTQDRVASVVGGVEVVGSLGLGYEGNNYNPRVISEDGSRILFGAPKIGTSTANGNSGPSDLYLRDTDTGGPNSTTWVSEPEAGVAADPTSPRLDAFQGASSDASKVFFTSGEKLTADSTGDPNTVAASFGDLYQYDYDTGDLRDISVDNGNADGARVRGFLGEADDGDAAYFVAQGQLGTGEGTDGGHNLFHWEDGPGNGTVTFIAELATTDGNTYLTSAPLRTARVTPNGRYLAFESDAPLTGDDLGPAGDRDVYYYDASTDALECVSCGADASNVDAQLRERNPFNYDLHTNITNSGGTVFFETPEALVPTDTNGVRDVYEFDTVADDVELISDGKSAHDSFFGNATPDGSSAFFFTRAQLVSSDGDDNYDAYVARTGGVFEDDSPAPCQGDDCQGEASSPPATTEPGTSRFAGPGNAVASKDCSKLNRKANKAERKAKRAKRKLRKARKADKDNKVERLKKQKKRKTRKAKRAERKAKKCKRQQREAK